MHYVSSLVLKIIIYLKIMVNFNIWAEFYPHNDQVLDIPRQN